MVSGVNLSVKQGNMGPASIRQKLHQYIHSREGNEKLLKLMYVIARQYYEDDDFDCRFTDEEIKLFEERTAKRLIGESKTYSREDAKDIITGQKKVGGFETIIEIIWVNKVSVR